MVWLLSCCGHSKVKNEVPDRPEPIEVPADVFRIILDKVDDWRDKIKLSLVNRQALAAGKPFLQLTRRVRRLGRNWRCRTLPAPRLAAAFRIRNASRRLSQPRRRHGQHETRKDILEVMMSASIAILQMYLQQATGCLRIRKADRMQWGQEGPEDWLVHVKVYMRTWAVVSQSSPILQAVCMGEAHLREHRNTLELRDETQQLLSSLFVPQLQVCLRPNPQDINKCVDRVLMSHFQGAMMVW